MSPVWGTRWTLPEAREILIGPKNDEFCFIVFPGASSVGNDATLEVQNPVVGKDIRVLLLPALVSLNYKILSPCYFASLITITKV